MIGLDGILELNKLARHLDLSRPLKTNLNVKFLPLWNVSRSCFSLFQVRSWLSFAITILTFSVGYISTYYASLGLGIDKDLYHLMPDVKT